MVDKKLPAVPETILKRRKRQAESRAARVKAAASDKVNRHKKRIDIFKRAERYVKEYRDKELDEIRLRREAKKEGNYYVKGDPKLAFVMRIRGINQVSPKVRKVLQLFRLRQINNGVFIKLNKATINMLRICGNYLVIVNSFSNQHGRKSTKKNYCVTIGMGIDLLRTQLFSRLASNLIYEPRLVGTRE